MMNIEEILDHDSNRIERKIILSKGQSYLFSPCLKEAGFSPTFPDRKITSIYFDDIELNALRDNIDGNRIRNKVRARFYDQNIKDSYIEIKQKRGFLGYKFRASFINLDIDNTDNLIKCVEKWSKENLAKEYFPVSQISYSRSYFQKEDFRATIDRNLNSFRLSSRGRRLYSSINDYEVIEFKYKPELDEDFRDLFESFGKNYIRITKSSKYSNSLMF